MEEKVHNAPRLCGVCHKGFVIPSGCGCNNAECSNHVDKWKPATSGYEPPKPIALPKIVPIAPAAAQIALPAIPKVREPVAPAFSLPADFIGYFGPKAKENPNDLSWSDGLEFANKWQAVFDNPSAAPDLLKDLAKVDQSYLAGTGWNEMSIAVNRWAAPKKKRGRPRKNPI